MVVTKVSRQICLAEYPVGMPTDNNFKLVQVDIPEPTKEGEFLVRNIWMSVDPYMRGRMRKEGGNSLYTSFQVSSAFRRSMYRSGYSIKK